MTYTFTNGTELLSLCQKYDMPISRAMLLSESERSEKSREYILSELGKNLEVMEQSIKSGLDKANSPHGVFVGGDAVKMLDYAPLSWMGRDMAEVVAAAVAVVEVNASMGRIVAAPTAGASGILPAVLIVCGEKRRFSKQQLCEGLLTAGAVGAVIARNASIAGASGGCQAETGTAAAMAAAALTELSGGTPPQVLTAAAVALKNIMGLICDPVGGLVECPCVKRNAIGAVNAVLSCDMAMAGIESLIPFDEIVDAMRRVGEAMSPDFRETARGGLADTETGKVLSKKIKQPE